MRQERLGELETRIAGGSDGAGGGDGPVVVLLHGFGAPGEDLVPLARYLKAPAGTRFVFPAAPIALPAMFGDARAWWMIDIEARIEAISRGAIDELTGDEPEGMAEANRLVTGLLDDVERVLGADPARTVLGGFSQGSMVAVDVALRSERPLAGLLIMSGTLLCAGVWIPKMEKRRGLPVLQSHGRSDPLLPFLLAERLRDHMRDAGLEVDWVEFEGGHEIPPPVLERAGQLLERALG